MDNHPESEEQLAEKGTPRLIATVNGVRNSSNNSNYVDNEESSWGNEKSGPFEHVELSKISIFVGCFRSNREVRINSSKNFKQTLEHGKQMGRHTSDNPKLLVSPPFIDSDATPSHFQNTSGKDRKKERNEPNTGKITNL